MSTNDSQNLSMLKKILKIFGISPMKVRWKLRAWNNSWKRYKRRWQQKNEHVVYEHKSCPNCGAVNDKHDTVCYRCQHQLGSYQTQFVKRFQVYGLSFNVSYFLGIVIASIYIRMIFAPESGGFTQFTIKTLLDFGGHWPPAVEIGQWWRLGTAIFLHAGIWHIGFNLIALSIVGPQVEQLYGSKATLAWFVITGLVGSVASQFFIEGVNIGASGAVMGLIGVAIGWGQRQGTSIGKAVRNGMLKWVFYTIVFGMFIGANNVAHIAGALSGMVIGYLVPEAKKNHIMVTILAAASFIIVVALWIIMIVPIKGLFVI